MMHVYIMTSESGPVKIGVSSFPKYRLRQIKHEGYGHCRLYRATNPHPKARRIESIAHELLSEFRLRGEWFCVDPADAVKAVERAFEMVEAGTQATSEGNLKNVRRYRDRLDTAGLARVTVRIPIELEAELKRIVSSWKPQKKQLKRR